MPETRSTQKWGWRPGLPDFRDLIYTPDVTVFAAMPKVVDLRHACPSVWDQGELGSCTAHAIGAAYAFAQLKEHETPFMPARLFIYYNERAIEGTISTDSGAMIRDGFKTIATQGVPREDLVPYNVSAFAVKPSVAAYADALRHKAITYKSIRQDLAALKSVLASGYPFAFGISVYSSFESESVTQNGAVPMPQPSESLPGGHAILCVGYDDSKQAFIFRNSWGTNWGDNGYGTLPYAYVTNGSLASDFWVVTTVEASG